MPPPASLFLEAHHPRRISISAEPQQLWLFAFPSFSKGRGTSFVVASCGFYFGRE
jgi:hypothetical protein